MGFVFVWWKEVYVCVYDKKFWGGDGVFFRREIVLYVLFYLILVFSEEGRVSVVFIFELRKLS